jgi:opine dehydrogenase
MSIKVTILGAGNGGHALGFDLSRRGHEVAIFEHPNFAKNLEGIRQRGGIEAVKTLQTEKEEIPAALAGFAKIAALTSDPKQAMDFADIVMMIVPSFAQETIFNLMLPHLRDGQIFMSMPGNMTSLVFKRMMKEAGVNKKVTFAESPSIPYAVRIVGPGRIFLLGIKDGFEIAALPAARNRDVIDRVKELFTLKLVPISNVIQAGLSNLNMIVHVPTATLSMGLGESRGGKYQFYAEGMSDSVSKVQQKVDDERVAIGRALGFNLPSFVEDINLWYSLKAGSIREFAVTTPIHNKFPNDAPKNPRERYISEDCPYVMVPAHEFGALTGVPHPAIESLIYIDSIYNDADYFKAGRTLEKMGLAGMSKEQVLTFVR